MAYNSKPKFNWQPRERMEHFECVQLSSKNLTMTDEATMADPRAFRNHRYIAHYDGCPSSCCKIDVEDLNRPNKPLLQSKRKMEDEGDPVNRCEDKERLDEVEQPS
jgi:hypothetical protein